MKHEADGVYYVTHKMLADNKACIESHATLARITGIQDRDKQIPITFKLLHHYHRARGTPTTFTDLWYLANILRRKRRITLAEADFVAGYAINQTPRAFMDMLARRAKREGKLK